MIRIIALLIALIGFVADAQASSTSLSIIINSPASTAISCPVQYPSGQTSFTAPLAAGTLVATCAVTPSGWSGALTLSGANASSFALSGMNLVVGSIALGAGNYAFTVTSTP